LAGAIAAMLGSCAHVEVPPGGPEDNDPPGILSTRPAGEEIVPGYSGPVVFLFDERISERGVEDAVLVSPRTSPVEVRHGREEIRVSLRRGWEPGQIYHVTLRPDIVDLFGNRLAGVETLVFSTGPDIPSTATTGTVIDRLTARPQSGVRVEAIRSADSLVYAVPTDSAGAFAFRQIPAGDYMVRAYQDVNRSRSLEPFEARDSTFVSVTESAPVEGLAFRLLAPDSTAPVAGTATLRQRRIEIEFDDYLNPDQVLDSTQTTVRSADGDDIEVVRVSVGPAAQIFPAPDDTIPALRRLPARQLVIELGDSVNLAPETDYTVSVRAIQNVNGLVSDVEVTVTTPSGPANALAVVSAGEPSRYILRRHVRRGSRTLNFVADNGRT
jgi:hypothetical protein